MAPVWRAAPRLRMSRSRENLSDHDPRDQRLRGGGLPARRHLRPAAAAGLRVRVAAAGHRRMALRPGKHRTWDELPAARPARDAGLVRVGPSPPDPPRLPPLPARGAASGAARSCPVAAGPATPRRRPAAPAAALPAQGRRGPLHRGGPAGPAHPVRAGAPPRPRRRAAAATPRGAAGARPSWVVPAGADAAVAAPGAGGRGVHLPRLPEPRVPPPLRHRPGRRDRRRLRVRQPVPLLAPVPLGVRPAARPLPPRPDPAGAERAARARRPAPPRRPHLAHDLSVPYTYR